MLLWNYLLLLFKCSKNQNRNRKGDLSMLFIHQWLSFKVHKVFTACNLWACKTYSCFDSTLTIFIEKKFASRWGCRIIKERTLVTKDLFSPPCYWLKGLLDFFSFVSSIIRIVNEVRQKWVQLLKAMGNTL